MLGSRLAHRLAAADPGGLLYGGLVSASMLVAISAHLEDFPYIALSTFGVLVTYWLAHVYIGAQSLEFDGDTRHALHRVWAAARHEIAVLQGGLPAIAMCVVGYMLGLSRGEAVSLAIYFSVVMLMAVGYLAATHAGRHGWAAVTDTVIAGLFGVLIVVAKAALH
jgi:hypothetical protein